MKKIIGLLLLMNSYSAWSQISQQVDYLTGSQNLTIPLYTLQDGELQYPLSLTYIGNGVHLRDVGGWMWQNWGCSADAGISRDMRGIADDYLGAGSDTRKGWLRGDMGTRIKNSTLTTDGNAATCSDAGSMWTFLNSFQYQDTEPDVFTVSVPGLSFQFYFDENQQYHVVPYQDITIVKTTDPVTGQITSFTVTDSQGVKYLFSDAEYKTAGMATSTIAPYYMNRKYTLNSTAYTYNYSWKLTSITSPTAGSIQFSYNEVSINSTLRKEVVFNLPVTITNAWMLNPITLSFSNQFTEKILTRIATSSTQVDFISDPDIAPSVHMLTYITISDTRTGAIKTIKSFDFLIASTHYMNGSSIKGWRNFLTKILEISPANSSRTLYTFSYYGGGTDGYTSLPFADTNQQDAWGFYSVDPTMGMLQKVSFLQGGYIAFFYEPHQYLDPVSNTTIVGGGIRTRKTITHDGLNSASDKIVEYEYLEANGQTSGKLFYMPKKTLSGAMADNLYVNGANMPNAHYREIAQMITNGTLTGPAGKYFTFLYSEDLGYKDALGIESAVAYDRVSVKQATIGKTIYEYDLPGMNNDLTANNNEWQASTVDVVQPSSGSSCYETGSVPLGTNQYPYPPNPNYGFARGLLKKITNINEQGQTVRDVVYQYQRLYSPAFAGIRKIYGLSFEDLPTYYYNGSTYTSSRMFLYSKYQVNVDVKTELLSQTESIYNNGDMNNFVQTLTSYYYQSSYHRLLTKVVTQNSNQDQFVKRFQYAADFPLTASDPSSAGIIKLRNDNRPGTLIENVNSIVKNSTEYFTNASLTTFQQLNNKAFPYQQFQFKAPEGVTTFLPASFQTSFNQLTFVSDPQYVATETFLNYNANGALTEFVGRSKQNGGFALAYFSTAPVLTVTNARLNELVFSDFENPADINFATSGVSPTYVSGRTGVNAITFTPSSQLIKSGVTNAGTKKYIFSCWVNTASSGNLTISLKNGGTNLINPVSVSYLGSAGWQYVTTFIDTSTLPSSFDVIVTTSATMSLDDIAFYPVHSSITMFTYNFPYGKATETDSRGVTTYYTYDEWGRLTLTKDQYQNIINKYDYQVKP